MTVISNKLAYHKEKPPDETIKQENLAQLKQDFTPRGRLSNQSSRRKNQRESELSFEDRG